VGTPYTSAKALAIAAPAVMLVTLRGLLAAAPLEGESRRQAEWWPPARLRPLVRVGVPALAGAFALAALFSTLLPLRQSAVGPVYASESLKGFRPLVDGQDVLFLGRDNFISWELLGSEVYAPLLNHYDTEETATLYRATPINAKFDWDNVPGEVLAGFDLVLTTSADFNSEAPAGFEPAARTEEFILWRRVEPVVPEQPGGRRTLLEPLYPGATLDCSEPGNSGLREIEGTAIVLPRAPVIGSAWKPSPDLTDAAGASEELALPPGRWAISIQYASTQELRIATDAGLDRTMRANLLFRGPSPYYPVGVVDVPAAGREARTTVRFDVSVARPPLAGRLLGTESRAYLGTIAATPAGGRQRVPLSEACGRYVDWYSVSPDTPGSALAGVEGPSVRPPQDDP
jgi:hypothetical protein